MAVSAVHDFGFARPHQPVEGRQVSGREIIHMDENGACKFPADKAAQVLELVSKLCAEEAGHMQRMREAAGVDDLAEIFLHKKGKM